MENIWGKRHRERSYTEPCSDANSVSYKTFCQLGALLNPRLRRMAIQVGGGSCSYTYSTYHLLAF